MFLKTLITRRTGQFAEPISRQEWVSYCENPTEMKCTGFRTIRNPFHGDQTVRSTTFGTWFDVTTGRDVELDYYEGMVAVRNFAHSALPVLSTVAKLFLGRLTGERTQAVLSSSRTQTM
jgi:hypothetical protein